VCASSHAQTPQASSGWQSYTSIPQSVTWPPGLTDRYKLVLRTTLPIDPHRPLGRVCAATRCCPKSSALVADHSRIPTSIPLAASGCRNVRRALLLVRRLRLSASGNATRQPLSDSDRRRRRLLSRRLRCGRPLRVPRCSPVSTHADTSSRRPCTLRAAPHLPIAVVSVGPPGSTTQGAHRTANPN
jgi:hypothetical protein